MQQTEAESRQEGKGEEKRVIIDRKRDMKCYTNTTNVEVHKSRRMRNDIGIALRGMLLLNELIIDT